MGIKSIWVSIGLLKWLILPVLFTFPTWKIKMQKGGGVRKLDGLNEN